MKKMKRIIAVALAFVLCLSLCGCRELDEMKARQATWTEDGNILWNGHTYVPLYDTLAEESYAYTYAEELNWNDSEVVYVTKPDVPVLLSEMLGTNGYSGADGLILEASSYGMSSSPAIPDLVYRNVIYCREDVYDWTLNALTNGYDIQEYGYYYYDYEKYEPKTGTFTDAQQQAIDEVLSTVAPMTILGDYSTNQYVMEITAYSKDHVFAKQVGEICREAGVYKLMYSYYDETDDFYTTVYDVPAKYTAVFDELFNTVGVVDNGIIIEPPAMTTIGDIEL